MNHGTELPITVEAAKALGEWKSQLMALMLAEARCLAKQDENAVCLTREHVQRAARQALIKLAATTGNEGNRDGEFKAA